MKIGDRVFVRGYIDEIRKDTVIIRNAGGYFGTIPSEVITGELPSAQPERKNGHWLRYGEDGYPNNEDTVFWQCNQCLEQYTGRTKRIPNFCPNCGAKMDGGDGNGTD